MTRSAMALAFGAMRTGVRIVSIPTPVERVR